MKRDIYPEINEFLIGTTEETHRHLKKETLETFRVGVGKEKFRNDSDQLSWFDAVYFPLYAPKSKKKQRTWKDTLTKKNGEELLAEQEMNTEAMELVRMKIRAIGKENKHRQKYMPPGSELR